MSSRLRGEATRSLLTAIAKASGAAGCQRLVEGLEIMIYVIENGPLALSRAAADAEAETFYRRKANAARKIKGFLRKAAHFPG